MQLGGSAGGDEQGAPGEATHPVRQVINDHRHWFTGVLRDLLAESGHPDPDGTAHLLVILRDGLVITADLDDPATRRPYVRKSLGYADAVELLGGRSPAIELLDWRRAG
ncbi:MAG: hypothetical protein GEV11_07070 [Streptosporangiales bacterium]|nr:hypothetical protein [Streptosporangiales bacterium]